MTAWYSNNTKRTAKHGGGSIALQFGFSSAGTEDLIRIEESWPIYLGTNIGEETLIGEDEENDFKS